MTAKRNLHPKGTFILSSNVMVRVIEQKMGREPLTSEEKAIKLVTRLPIVFK
jgi:hypothetical protein